MSTASDAEINAQVVAIWKNIGVDMQTLARAFGRACAVFQEFNLVKAKYTAKSYQGAWLI